ncbi:MAG: TRAP transporter substrate-binding protein DctP [Rhodospirillaceae bacterium]|nr:TRAP transporter substrate-binding protein DctP [Rhodospirillaceae bacterium]
MKLSARNSIGAAAAAAVLAIAATAAAETTVRAVGFIPKNHPVMAQANAWVKAINEKLKGKFQVNYVGGPEVIGRYEQLNAIRNGVIDMLFAAEADFQDQIPEVGAFTLSRLSPAEERKSGFYDMMAKAHERVNVRYIGRVQYGDFYLWFKKKPENLASLKGLKMRTGSLYDKFMRKLGMVPVTINAPETYTALEQGTVDGLGWPVFGVKRLGWSRQVKYVLDLPFYGASNIGALMNINKWKSLPPDVQKSIMDVTAEFEPKMVTFFKAQQEKEWANLKGEVTRVKFSDAENKTYLDTAYEVEWEAMAKRVSPEVLAQLRKMTGN